MITDNHSNFGIEITGLPLPQQLDETMILLGYEDSQLLFSAELVNVPLHLELVSDVCEIRL
ncbi:hypothetical protein D3C76_1869320 [compost metagenome]